MTMADEALYALLKSESESKPDFILAAIEKMIIKEFPDEGGAHHTSQFIISYCLTEILRFRETLLEAWLK